VSAMLMHLDIKKYLIMEQNSDFLQQIDSTKVGEAEIFLE